MPQQPTKAQQRAMHRKHVFFLTDGPRRPIFWGNYFSIYWYATKDIPYTEWKGDTQSFQEYLWDVRTLRGYDKAHDSQFDVSSLPDEVIFDPKAFSSDAFAEMAQKQRLYHYSVLCAAEIPPSNGVRQFWLADDQVPA